jgi:transposase
MLTITTIGLDIAKSVFQVHGVDADGKVVLRRQLNRRYVLAFFQKLPACLVGIKACASKDKGRSNNVTQVSMRSAIGWSVVIVIGLVCELTSLVTARNEFLPPLLLDSTHLAPLASYSRAPRTMTIFLSD